MNYLCPNAGCGGRLADDDVVRGFCPRCRKPFELPLVEPVDNPAAAEPVGTPGPVPVVELDLDSGEEEPAPDAVEPRPPCPAKRGRALLVVLACLVLAAVYFFLSGAGRHEPAPPSPEELEVPAEEPYGPEPETLWERYLREEAGRRETAPPAPAGVPAAGRPFRLEPLTGSARTDIIVPEHASPAPAGGLPAPEPGPVATPAPAPRPAPASVMPRAVPAPAPVDERGSLRIVSAPAGALVYLGGVRRGETPLTIGGLEPGVYPVRLEKEGHVVWGRQVLVRAGDENPVEALLTVAGRRAYAPAPAPAAGPAPEEAAPAPRPPAPARGGFAWRGATLGDSREDIARKLGRAGRRGDSLVYRLDRNREAIVFTFGENGLCREIEISEPGIMLPETLQVGDAEGLVFGMLGQPVGYVRRDRLDNLATPGIYFYNDQGARISYPDRGYRFLFDSRRQVSWIIVHQPGG